jgi:hypothetical protein
MTWSAYDYKLYCKRQPDSAKARKAMADVYRKLRRQNAEIARLLWQREKAASKIIVAGMIDNLYQRGTG